MAPYTVGQTGGKVLAPTYKCVRTKCAHSYAIYIYIYDAIYINMTPNCSCGLSCNQISTVKR